MRYFGEFWNALGVLVTGPDWDLKSSRENWLSHSLYQNWNLKSKQWCYWICSLCHTKGDSHDARRGCTHLSHSCTSRPLHWKRCHVWQPSKHARKEVLLQVKIVNKKTEKTGSLCPTYKSSSSNFTAIFIRDQDWTFWIAGLCHRATCVMLLTL